MVNNRYADYLKNQVDWEHNDTRDLILKMKIAIEQLAAERDEARRDVCSMMHMTGFLGGDYAHSKGWDCFKDVHTGFSPEIQNFRDIFYRHKDELRSDRDEARREVCKLKSLNFEGKITPEDYALLRKWDCFKTVSTEKS
jgi:hypothetical protein